MDQETWELVEIHFPHRAEALRDAKNLLEKLVQASANMLHLSDSWGQREETEPEGAGSQMMIS